MKRLVAIFVLGVLCVLGAPASRALVIDNFEQGGITVIDSDINDLLGDVVGAVGEQSGLGAENVADGVRLVSVVATDSDIEPPDLNELPFDLPIPVSPPEIGGTATALLLAPLPGGIDDGVQLSALGGAVFRLTYDGIAGGNVGSGVLGALGLDLSGLAGIRISALGVTGGVGEIPPAEVRIGLSDSSLTSFSGFFPLLEGNNLVPLGFGFVDVSDIQQISVTIRGISTQSQLQITSIDAVPEPGTGLLLAGALAGLGFGRRIRRVGAGRRQ